jgi:hypothetical protein
MRLEGDAGGVGWCGVGCGELGEHLEIFYGIASTDLEEFAHATTQPDKEAMRFILAEHQKAHQCPSTR